MPLCDGLNSSRHLLLLAPTVMVAPAAGFYSTPGVGLNQIRIAYVLNEESLKTSVKVLAEALKVYKD